jgi:hypothetical protein
VAQTTNRSLLGFEAQTKKPSRWFWGPNHQTGAADFEAQTEKCFTTLVLRLNQETDHQFWGQTGRNRHHQFWGQIGENRRSRFWGQTARNRHHCFEAKPAKTVRVVLWPNHSQTVDLGFMAQPRNPRF